MHASAKALQSYRLTLNDNLRDLIRIHCRDERLGSVFDNVVKIGRYGV